MIVEADDLLVCKYGTAVIEAKIPNPTGAEVTVPITVTGDAAEWATYPEEVKINPHSWKTVPVFLTAPPEAKLGEYILKISGGSESKKLKIFVQACYGIKIVAEEYVSVCAGKETKLPITVRNEGKFDELVSFESDYKIEPFALEIEPGRNATAEMTIPALNISESQVTVSVKSDKTRAEDSAQIKIMAIDCYKKELILPQEAEVCAGEKTKIDMRIKNEGKFDDVLTVESDSAIVIPGKKYVAIKAGEDAIVPLEIFSDEEGIYEVTITATGKTVLYGKLKVQSNNCYKFEVKAKDMEACPGQTVELPIIVSNPGPYNLSLVTTVTSDLAEKRFEYNVGPGNSVKLSYKVGVPLGAESETMLVRSYNSEESDEQEVNLEVLPYGECYSVAAHSAQKAAMLGKETILEVLIENNGKATQSYSLSADGAIVEPASLIIKPGGSESAYLLVKYDEPGNYQVKLNIESDYLSVYTSVPIEVIDQATPAGLLTFGIGSSKVAGYAMMALGVIVLIIALLLSPIRLRAFLP